MPGVKAFLTKLLHKKIDHTGLPGVDVHSHDDQYFQEAEHLSSHDGSVGVPVVTGTGGKVHSDLLDVAAKTKSGVTYIFQDEEVVLTPGAKCLVYIEQPFVIESIKLNGDVAGDITLDLWWEADAENGGVPTVGDSIVGANPPTWVTKQAAFWTDFTGWTTTDITAGGWLMVELTSISDFNYLQIQIVGSVYTGP